MDSATTNELNFEQALARLEQITQSLEDNKLGLESALGMYGEGVGLLRQCQQLLQQAERKIELLTGVDSAGNPIQQPFDDAATFSAETATKTKSGLGRKRKGSTTTDATSASVTAPVAATPPVKSDRAQSSELAPWEDLSSGEPRATKDDLGSLF